MKPKDIKKLLKETRAFANKKDPVSGSLAHLYWIKKNKDVLSEAVMKRHTDTLLKRLAFASETSNKFVLSKMYSKLDSAIMILKKLNYHFKGKLKFTFSHTGPRRNITILISTTSDEKPSEDVLDKVFEELFAYIIIVNREP